MSPNIQKSEENKPEAVEDRRWVTPRVDVYENDQELLLIADIPGVEKEDLKIHLDQDQLVIQGEVHQKDQGNILGREYEAFDYRRTFRAPVGIDAKKITADLKLGVLYLHLSKSEKLRPRQIPVKAG